jgi:hypothetical protein
MEYVEALRDMKQIKEIKKYLKKNTPKETMSSTR